MLPKPLFPHFFWLTINFFYIFPLPSLFSIPQVLFLFSVYPLIPHYTGLPSYGWLLLALRAKLTFYSAPGISLLHPIFCCRRFQSVRRTWTLLRFPFWIGFILRSSDWSAILHSNHQPIVGQLLHHPFFYFYYFAFCSSELTSSLFVAVRFPRSFLTLTDSHFYEVFITKCRASFHSFSPRAS